MRLRRLGLWGAAFGLGFGGTLAAAAAFDLRDEPRTGDLLGPIDFFIYCIDEYGPLASASLITDDASGWRCATRERGIFAIESIDVNEACTVYYGVDATAEAFDPSWAYSWRCYRA